MTSPATSLPFAIKELMTYTSVTWEETLGQNQHGEINYVAPVEIPCWMEGEGFVNAGVNAARAQGNAIIEQMTRELELELYFDGDDSRVQSFKMTDRFTPNNPGGAGIALQPTIINTFWGPNFDNASQWLTVVGF